MIYFLRRLSTFNDDDDESYSIRHWTDVSPGEVEIFISGKTKLFILLKL